MQTVYNIINRFVVDDRATRAVGRMAAAYSGLNGQIYRTRSAMGTLLATGGTIGAFLLLTQLKKGLYDYNAEIEQANIGMGAIFNAARRYRSLDTGQLLIGIEKYNAAFAETNRLIKNFQLDAAKSVGTTRDFIDIAKQIADPMLRMGKGPEDLRYFTGLVVNAATVLGVDFPQASRDMMSSLTGVAGIDVKLYRLLGSPGGGAKAFNALAPTARFDLLVKAMERYKVAADQFEMSGRGLWTTIIDVGQIALGRAGKPLFETWKDMLKDVLKWITANRDAIFKFADAVGNKLAKAFIIIKNTIKYLIDHRDEIKKMLLLFGAYRVTQMLYGVSNFRGMYQKTSDWTKRAGEASQLSKAGYPNLAFMAMYPTLGKFLNLFRQGGLTAALSKAGPALAVFAKVLLIILAVVALISALIMGFLNNTLKCADHFKSSINKFIATVIQIVDSLSPAIKFIWTWGGKLVNLIGGLLVHALAYWLDTLTFVIQTTVKHFAGLWSLLKYTFSMEGLKNLLNAIINPKKYLKNLWDAYEKGFTGYQFKKDSRDYFGEFTKGLKAWGEPKLNAFGEPDVPFNVTNINGGVHIHQEFKENYEPDRVAFATVELLNRIASKPVQPRRAMPYQGTPR